MFEITRLTIRQTYACQLSNNGISSGITFLRSFSFGTAILLPLFLIDSVEAALPLAGFPKYAAVVAAGALIMSAAVWLDRKLEERLISR